MVIKSASASVREQRQQERYGETLKDRPFVGHITKVDGTTEKHTIVTPGPTRELESAHHYFGVNSWVRTLPEAGAKPIIAYRSDRETPLIIGYHQEQHDVRLTGYMEGRDVYRTLNPGEHELHSPGYAQIFMGIYPVLDKRAGTSRESLDDVGLERVAKAGTHLHQGINHTTDKKLNDEQRFGLVKRYSGTSVSFSKADDKFLKEFSTNLTDIEGNPLYNLQSGHVVNETGVVVKQTITAKPLRQLEEFYTKDGNKLAIEIDEDGNINMAFPDNSSEGYTISIPKGSYNLTVQNDVKMNGKNFRALMDNRFAVDAGGSKLNLNQGKIELGAQGIGLVQTMIDLLQTLSIDTYKGFGALSDQAIAQKYSQMAQKLQSILGSL